MERILVVGANGQIGSELVEALSAQHDVEYVIASDIGTNLHSVAHYEQLDVLDAARMAQLIEKNQVTQVYQLAALLSVAGEQAPLRAWTLNIGGLLNLLEIARGRGPTGTPLQIFWPSSIAAFGPHTPAVAAPQTTIMDPTTIYGISKLAGERLCEYYFHKFSVDVRSIRYPGIVSYKSPPGGGTTDYAIAIFHAALEDACYQCYLGPDTTLPMMYMPDAIRAAIALMNAPAAQIRVRSAYNVAGMSFSPQQLAQAIQRVLPQFEIRYAPDGRQVIADSWPQSLDDTQARTDWGWQAQVELDQMVADMLAKLLHSKQRSREVAPKSVPVSFKLH